MHFFSAVSDYFGGFMHPGVNACKRTLPSAKASALSEVHQSETGQPSAGMCSLVIEEPRTAIEFDPALSILLKLRKWQRLRLVESRMQDGGCAIRIMVEPAGRVAVLSGPDARSICDALTGSGEAWGRVLGIGDTAVGTYRVDLILFWRKSKEREQRSKIEATQPQLAHNLLNGNSLDLTRCVRLCLGELCCNGSRLDEGWGPSSRNSDVSYLPRLGCDTAVLRDSESRAK